MPNITPPPQENSGFAAPQQAAPNINEAKQQVLAAINEFGINPKTLINLGQMAEKAIKDKGLYPMVKQAAIQANLIDELDLKKGIDYQFLAIMATMAKITQQMIQSGEIQG